MLTLDQIARELKAIERFDTLYLLEEEHTAEAMIAFRARQMRKRELMKMVEKQDA